MSGWKRKLVSGGGHLVLVNSILSNMVLYMLSFFEVSKGYFKDWTTSVQGSFDREIVRKKVYTA